jgi:hypothetical protein
MKSLIVLNLLNLVILVVGVLIDTGHKGAIMV